jgi:hypothetical protein
MVEWVECVEMVECVEWVERAAHLGTRRAL